MTKKLITERTAAELKEELRELRRRISETERQELLGPFIEMALEAQKLGLVEPMRSACIAVLDYEHTTAHQVNVTADVVAESGHEEAEIDLEDLIEE